MNIEKIELLENCVSCLIEQEINPADITSAGFEDHDYFLTLKNGETISFSCERTR